MRRSKRLTAKTVQHAPPGKHADGDGLTLVVKPSGTRSWVVRLTVDGKQRDIGIGGYPGVSLADARLRAAEMRADAIQGNDPTGAERTSDAPTFAVAAKVVHEMNLPRWRNKHAANEWLASLERYAFDRVGNVPMQRIERSDVIAVLSPIWTTKPETARRVRQRIRKVMQFGMAHGWVDTNPAGEAIDGALPSMPKVKNHQRALPYSEVPAAVNKIAQSRASEASKLCLRFLVLTAVRSGEARGARWFEIDAANATWTIPAERMKANGEHRVPLSRQALSTLQSARALEDGSGLIFPSPLRRGEPLSWQALLKLLRTYDMDTTVHGFRSAFKTWCIEQTATPWAVGEAALAHVVGNSVEAAYVRSDLFDQRRELMQDWADFVAP
ncbi:tyrosine-type recombinase/integrase [Candidatus Poriferisodalis sp.]|uniref:tyrosine-type recombinase/integrase n=1 Tax=Candidatus Poriferisodalis sp. TaxID=3101277 RepID=UPI003D0FD273